MEKNQVLNMATLMRREKILHPKTESLIKKDQVYWPHLSIGHIQMKKKQVMNTAT